MSEANKTAAIAKAEILAEIKNEFASGDYFILYLDDEESLRNIFVDEMAELGIKVVAAADSDEAMSILEQRTQQVAMIASDLRMPEVDGLQFREKTLKRFSAIPFCVISAWVNRDLALKGVELKISAFLLKPIDVNQLLDILHREVVPRVRALKEERELTMAFVADGEALLEEGEEILLKLESALDAESLNRYYAIMHTLKGGAGFCEPKTLHQFVHAYEDILKNLQGGEISLTDSVMSALVTGFDTIRLLFSDIRNGSSVERDLGSLLSCLAIDEEEAQSRFANAAKAEEAAQANARAKVATHEDIKVSVKLLDEFMQLSGEVTVIRNMLNKCVSSIEKKFAGDPDVGMLSDILAELHKINSGMQNKITEIRKVPLKSVMRVLPRAVRDVSKSLEKKVDLRITGDELRVDASIADVLHNSLLHIIKNSIDHGIEKGPVRVANAKDETGKIRVEALARDEKVIVKISDDGAGLNKDAIKARLIKNGTHDKAQVDAMPEPELFGMIFSPGFSTAQKVTEISGRGVGMSMVKDCVDAIGGRIVILSDPGKGASFQLELPVPKSIFIANCLSVKVGQQKFSLVRDEILRVMQFGPEQVEANVMSVDTAEFLLFEGSLVPIANINDMLDLQQETLREGGWRRFVLLSSGNDGRRLALEVTAIEDVEDMVIKEIHASLNKSHFYRGVTFLDKGEIGLVVSTEGLMDAIKVALPRKRTESVGAEVATSARTEGALLVEVRAGESYAIRQQKVFRVEELTLPALRAESEEILFPYRESIMRVVELTELFVFPEQGHGKSVNEISRKAQVVVIKDGDSFLGIAVDRVVDMVDCGELKTDLARSDMGVEGHFFVADKTVALIDLESLLANKFPRRLKAVERELSQNAA